jgi:hypothetical protein
MLLRISNFYGRNRLNDLRVECLKRWQSSEKFTFKMLLQSHFNFRYFLFHSLEISDEIMKLIPK